MTAVQRYDPAVRERGWRLIVIAVGIAQVAVGVAIFVNGADGFTLDSFPTWHGITWWVWGASALGAGAAILLPRVELVGLWGAAGWWALWSGVLVIGIARAGGPFASCAVYAFMAFIHLVLAIVTHLERRNP